MKVNKNLVSERHQHTGKNQYEGYCLICGEFCKLKWDHVPPQGSVTITKTQQLHIMEAIGLKERPKIKGAISNNGSKFRTLCEKCNSEILGGLDAEIQKVCKSVTLQAEAYYLSGLNPFPFAKVDFDVMSFTRAMVGHVLSATTAKECALPIPSSPYFDPLRKFVLEGGDEILETHDFYMWFYPFKRHLSSKFFAMINGREVCVISLLSFYPIAFLITQKNFSNRPKQAKKIDLGSSFIKMSLSPADNSANFPFVSLKDDQMCMLNDSVCIMSIPISSY